MIKTIIFDIGRVLIGYDWDAYILKLFNQDKEKLKRIRHALFERGYWNEVDRGVWSKSELMDAFSSEDPGLRPDIEFFWDNVGGALWQYDFTKDWIKELHEKGYQLLYLSNWSENMRLQCQEQLDFLPLLDGGVFSYEEKLIKPDHAIYECIIKRYNLIPEECVFLDDKIENVNAAIECGMHGIQVTSHDFAVEELNKLLNC